MDAPAGRVQTLVDGARAGGQRTAGEDINAAGPNSAFHVVNGIGGGPFALQFRARTIDIEHESVVRFAYRIEPGAMIDFYLVSPQGDFNPRHQGCYRWRLTGPKEDNSGTLSDEFAPLVGEFPNVVADGKWHALQFDLQPSWREFWRRRGFPRGARLSLRPIFGNLDNTGYLLAGMNGNHAGAAYSVTEIKSLLCENTDKSAPSVARVVWPFDAEGDGHSIAVYFNEPGGSGVQTETLRVALDETPVSVSTLSPTARPRSTPTRNACASISTASAIPSTDSLAR